MSATCPLDGADALVLADRYEDEGHWELAAWSRLMAGSGLTESVQPDHKTYTAPTDQGEVYVSVGTGEVAHVFITLADKEGNMVPEWWSWWEDKGWATQSPRCYVPVPRCPRWVREALRQACQQAVTAVTHRGTA